MFGAIMSGKSESRLIYSKSKSWKSLTTAIQSSLAATSNGVIKWNTPTLVTLQQRLQTSHQESFYA